jgi:signal transduction histidine kinase
MMKRSGNQILRKMILPDDAATSKGLDYWRNEFFFMVTRLIAISGVILLSVSIFSYVRGGQAQMIFPVSALTVLIYVFIFGRNIKPTVRRWGMIVLFFMIGIYLLIQTGGQGTALIFLFAHPIIAAVFFGRREAQISLWANGLMMSALNILLYLMPEYRVVVLEYQPLMWVTITLTFLFLSAVVTNAITRLVMGLTESLKAEVLIRTELEEEIHTRILLEETLKEERESLQVRVDERTSLLAKANEDLMKSMKFKDAFFDSIQHEFRTPIHAISGYTDLLFAKRDTLTEKQQNYLNRIRESSDHLLGVVNNILDTTRIQAGMLDIQPMVVSLSELCKNALAYVEDEAVRKRVTIDPIEGELKINIMADPQRFKQVLINLLENSVKYTPEGGSMGIIVENNEIEVRVTVWDTGIGIPDADINHIFEPFYRSDNRHIQDVEGTGLGLSLAKQLVDAHDWSLSVDSELGVGSRFTVHIPKRDVTTNATMLYY